MKSPEPENKAQRKIEKMLQKISAEIIRENYELVYQSRGKCEIYRDTGVSKKTLYVVTPLSISLDKYDTKSIKIRLKLTYRPNNRLCLIHD